MRSQHSTLAPHFTFDVKCFESDGVTLKWHEVVKNLVVTTGENDVGEVYFRSGTQKTAWYLGFKNTGTVVAGDTLASHSGWTEFTGYTGNRQAITFGAFSTGSSTITPIAFTANATGTVSGALIASVASGTSGLLYSAANFTGGDQPVVSGNVLTVSATVSF